MMRKTILSLALVLAMLLSLGCTGLSAYADSSALHAKGDDLLHLQR